MISFIYDNAAGERYRFENVFSFTAVSYAVGGCMELMVDCMTREGARATITIPDVTAIVKIGPNE